jgi:hypothetical protein
MPQKASKSDFVKWRVKANFTAIFKTPGRKDGSKGN